MEKVSDICNDPYISRAQEPTSGPPKWQGLNPLKGEFFLQSFDNRPVY